MLPADYNFVEANNNNRIKFSTKNVFNLLFNFKDMTVSIKSLLMLVDFGKF